MGNQSARIYYCCNDPRSVGLLQMGSSLEKKDDVYEGMSVKVQVLNLQMSYLLMKEISAPLGKR